MLGKCSKKLVLIKTLYYRIKNQNGQLLNNATEFLTSPKGSEYGIVRLTNNKYNPVKNEYVVFNTILIPARNNISGITEQTIQEGLLIKTKTGFVNAETFYFDNSETTVTTIDSADYYVTASYGDLKNAVLVRIKFDNDGTTFSNGVKFARKISIYGYK